MSRSTGADAGFPIRIVIVLESSRDCRLRHPEPERAGEASALSYGSGGATEFAFAKVSMM